MYSSVVEALPLKIKRDLIIYVNTKSIIGYRASASSMGTYSDYTISMNSTAKLLNWSSEKGG